MSSLAAQLAQNASLNTALLVDRSRRKPVSSYLFTGREADQHDLQAIHALGVNSLLHLASVNPALEKYEHALFSDQAKATDRTLLPADASDELDKSIEEFLLLLGPYLMEAPTGKILEWLVRRFRINEFNVEAILALFLPYHESPHFAKMVTILHLKPNTTWGFLIPYKSAAQNLPRVSLVTEMLRNPDLTRFVAFLLPAAIKKGLSHRTLLAFNAATLHDFIKRSKALDEGTLAHLLPALLEPLQQKGRTASKDSILGSYILLASLSQKCELSPAALKVIVGAMAGCASSVRGDQFVSSLVAVCEPQKELERFTDGTLKSILRIPNIDDELVSGSTWSGSEKILSPIVKGLTYKLSEESSVDILKTVIAASTTSLSVIETMTTLLIQLVLKPEVEKEIVLVARHLLSLIQQRYPLVLQRVAEALGEDDESVNDAVAQLTISLSMTKQVLGQNSNDKDIDMVLASASADATVRVSAVKDLIKSISGKGNSEIEDIASIRGALIARLQDTNVQVLEALYENPVDITPALSSDPAAYLSSLSLAVASSTAKPKRSVLRLHLAYLASHFWITAAPSTREDIFHQIIFPFLLFSKPRQKTAELVWEIISSHLSQSTGSSITEWLVGCAAYAKPEGVSEATKSVDLMNQINFNVSGKIADNILSSNDFSAHFDTLIAKFRDPNPHITSMAYLIALALVKKLSGEHQIVAARRIMIEMHLEELSGVDDLLQGDVASEFFNDLSFGKSIITKPSSKPTLHWIQIAIVVAISQIPRPGDLTLNWLIEPAVDSVDRGDRYVHLMRFVYKLANVSTTLPVLASTLLQSLFINLKDDALAFLAGIWATRNANDDNLQESRRIALLHAAAFLEADILEDDGMDFQTILPALLVALQDPDSEIRQGALECISRIRILSDCTLKSVYRFDAIYGSSDRTLQYLNQENLKRYLHALVEHRDHFINDASYVKVFHEQHLLRTKTDKKRDADYKHRVVCYILSHINAFCLETAQSALLKLVVTIQDKAKIQILLPTIHALSEKASLAEPANIFASASEELTTLMLSCFDATAASHLKDADSWNVFIKVVRTYFRAGTPSSPQGALARVVEDGLFPPLDQQRKIAVCEELLEIGSGDSSGQSSARNLLSKILVDIPLMVYLLGSLAPAAASASPRASKRVKTNETSDDTLPRLSLLAEILGTKSLPGSLDLIAQLLDTLNKVVQAFPPAQADVSYIEQLLMSAVESAASKITEVPNLSPSVIRLDILVELIRVSGNPRTFHQALLLMANLARLAPESVLYNVMPVFTFMGSNVFHRDDAYSFKVVQQTIDGIVPVMVSSLKQTYSQPIDLYLGSKEFLHVFTDAANHIPRHRRNKFFAHLVDVLGAKDFLPPITMLLLEKTANRIVRQPLEEMQNTLSLPISVFQHSEYALQIHTANEILIESQRLATRVVDPNSIQPVFLEGTADGDHSNSSSTNLKRRAHALILFVGYALKPRNSTAASLQEDMSLSTVIANLISLATFPGGQSNETKIDEVVDAARSSMNRLLSSMSVINFIQSVKAMLESGDDKVQAGALELLGKRLPDVSAQLRVQITDTVNTIIASIKNLLTTHKEGPVVTSAFQALNAIALTICPGEESSMTELVPFALSASKERPPVAAALAALSSMSTKLGPRIIPFFRQIISQSITVLRSEDSVLFSNAFAILQGLLNTIPTFWGSSEVTQIVFLYMDQSTSTSTSISPVMASVMKSVAKKTPTKVLLPTLLDMWPSLQTSRHMTRITAYFEVLAKALQYADRPTVLEHLRSSFQIFLEALDIVKVDEQVESRVLSAFRELVVKLNEAAFRPLFRRLYDWAFAGDAADTARKVTFGHLYIGLLDFFKGLMVPYMSFLLQPYTDILKSFTTSETDDFALWSSVVQTLSRSLNLDDGAFWRDDKLRQISTVLTGQIEVSIRLNFVDGKSQLQDCFSGLLETVTDDTLLKTINLNILMQTRSEDSRVRLFALSCSEALWRSHGGKLLGFVAETATFIAECSEDENDVVVKGSFKLKDAVESVAGPIDGL
ncbi:hypothetical protein B0H34DRAFT_800000 [Crassisporium funariophilum]|nr:hypothetical protein B0H34DRAFT_800000 [Crassisporium funariophilum]